MGAAPGVLGGPFGLVGTATELGGLTFRQRGILVTATAATIRDSYCSMAWGSRLATKAGPEVAAGVLSGDDSLLEPLKQALAAWARQVAGDPNATTAADVQRLVTPASTTSRSSPSRSTSPSRLAFSTVNDALGATPDVELAASLPPAVRDAVGSDGNPKAEAPLLRPVP